MARSGRKKNAIIRTTGEYASEATIHGVGYVFNKELPTLDRILWVIFCFGFAFLAVFWTHQAYSVWREDQVITTLKNTAKPVTEIEFPMVAICTDGLHMENVENIMWENFNEWRENQTKVADEGEMSKEMARYMLEEFQIKDESINILDILDTMVSDEDASVDVNSVVKIVEACSESTSRKKRSLNDEHIDGRHLFYYMYIVES